MMGWAGEGGGTTGLSSPDPTKTHYEASCPGIEQQQGADEKSADQQDADSQQEAAPQAQVLLPEEEGVTIGVAGEPQACVVAADGSDFFYRFHEV